MPPIRHVQTRNYNKPTKGKEYAKSFKTPRSRSRIGGGGVGGATEGKEWRPAKYGNFRQSEGGTFYLHAHAHAHGRGGGEEVVLGSNF